MMTYGYVRVSSADQNDGRQMTAMSELRIPASRIYVEGIAAARARGVRFGRAIKKPPENFAVLVKWWERGKLPIAEIFSQTGLKEATFYKRLREHHLSK